MRITEISILQEKQHGASSAVAQRHRCARKEASAPAFAVARRAAVSQTKCDVYDFWRRWQCHKPMCELQTV